MSQNFERRFSGIARLYGQATLDQFTQSHVVIIGVGGVGAWTAESLARSGIGALTLIDLDHLVESNINRQIHALSGSLGQAKVAALAERIVDINSRCRVDGIEDFITQDNLSVLLGKFVGLQKCLIIDCIDHAQTKAALIAWCAQHEKPVITVGAAGGRIDSTLVRVADLSQTFNDILLASTRKNLRQKHGFSRNLKNQFSVPAIYSKEVQLAQAAGDDAPKSSDLNCSGYGSVTHVTASFGLAAAGKALEMLKP